MKEKERIKKYTKRAAKKLDRTLEYLGIFKREAGYRPILETLESTVRILSNTFNVSKPKGYDGQQLRDYCKKLNEFLYWCIFEVTHVNRKGVKKVNSKNEDVKTFPKRLSELVNEGVSIVGSKIYKYKI